jgi:hypothetical protein
MGNSQSSNNTNNNNYTNYTNNSDTTKKSDEFYEVIDFIATNYILTMNFKSLSKLSEKAYCDKLIVLTSDIIQKNFSDKDVTYLAHRVKNGLDVNELKDEKVMVTTKDSISEIENSEEDSIKKKRVCIGIAKFYVKIAHIFAAIVMTINPVYTYKDSKGATVKVGLMEKDKIPVEAADKKLHKLGICESRIDILKEGSPENVQPNVCSMNLGENGTGKTLADEPGITELTQLYLDDNYDFSNGMFTGMSEETKSQFMKDLHGFYTAFTGNEKMPDSIKKFSDIKLRDYSKNPGCQGDNPKLKQKYSSNDGGSSSNKKLFVDYANNLRQMMSTAAENQTKLLSIINELFTNVNDEETGKKVIRINPKLTEESLQRAVEKTRRFIVDLYIRCETDFVKGVKLYEAIVESKILETTQKQIDNLKVEANKMIHETRAAVAPIPLGYQQAFIPEYRANTNMLFDPTKIPFENNSSEENKGAEEVKVANEPSEQVYIKQPGKEEQGGLEGTNILIPRQSDSGTPSSLTQSPVIKDQRHGEAQHEIELSDMREIARPHYSPLSDYNGDWEIPENIHLDERAGEGEGEGDSE